MKRVRVWLALVLAVAIGFPVPVMAQQPAPSPGVGPGAPGAPPIVSPGPGQPAPTPAPAAPGQPGIPPSLAPIYPAPSAGQPAFPAPGAQAPGAPSTLMPIAPPVPGTAGQPLPPSPVPAQAQAAPGQVQPAEAATMQVVCLPIVSVAPGQPRPPAGPQFPVGGTCPPGTYAASLPIPPQVPAAGPAPGAPAPTFIERAFSELQAPLTVDRSLRQFGYNLFEAPSGTFAPVQDVPVGPDYVVGPGDTLVVYMWGQVENNLSVVVDRDGEIILPRTGPIRVWGLKFSEMETLVRNRLSQYFTGFNLSITMGALRTIKVFILGDVVRPGAYTVSSISTITNALFAAAGPSPQGSLRDIRLIRNNQIIARLDLYKFLLEGSRVNDERLMANDTIFVPSIGRVVAVAGYVKRPAIYEVKEEKTLGELLDLAGGLTILSYVKRVQVERIVERQRKVALDIEFTDLKDFEAKTAAFPFQEGDFVSVFPIDRSLYRFVSVERNVRRPGLYALKPDMRIRDLIEQAEGLLPGTYMARADLARFYDGRQYETVPVDLDAAMAGDPPQNLALNEFDRVIVYHQLDVRPRPLVQITGALYRPGIFELTPNMRVSDLVFKASPTRQAFFKKAEMYRADPGVTVKVIPLDLEQILGNPRGSSDLLLTDRDHIFIREQVEGIEKRTVAISGRIRYLGEYAITTGERLSSLLERAGGFQPDAFPKGAVFTRESIRRNEREQLEKFIRTQEQSLLAESAATTAGAVELTSTEKGDVTSAQASITAQRRELLRSLTAAATIGRLAIRVDSPEKLKGTADDILLEDGDSLFIPQQPTSVLVLGAVRNSTSILHKDGESVEYYIARAGGPTRDADLDQTYVLKADGSALASFVKLRKIETGDAIVVPISTEPRIRTIPLLKDLATIAGGFAIPFGVIVGLYR